VKETRPSLSVVAYITDVVSRPLARPQLEDDDTGVFSLKAVPRTNVGLVWTLDFEHRQVVLAHVGPIRSSNPAISSGVQR
jgi:hypothetical protein